MRQVDVQASRCYRVSIGSGMLHSVGERVHALTKAEKLCIITDRNVWPLYGEPLAYALSKAGFYVCTFVMRPGEESKNWRTYLDILECLATHGLSRDDCILALGGGVVGDLAGFAAATYLRGIPYIQLPTSLLAMVDSSVGGKTAIDLDAGKNLVGAFYQPVAVLCDTDTLRTLPNNIFLDGCAEVIKYGVLYDAPLFAQLEAAGPDFDREAVIARCVQLKRDAVAADEFDRGQRKKLNLGHTIGHAIEKRSNYTISHGKAVAIGMAIVCRAAKCPDTERIDRLLRKFSLPCRTDFSAAQLYEAALSDKKRSGAFIDLIIPNSVGDCAIVPTPVENLKTFIEEGL